MQKDEELNPGSKGLALSQDQWKNLREAMPDLSKAVEAEDLKASFDLGSCRYASVTSFKGRLNVDLREHYEKEGIMAPGHSFYHCYRIYLGLTTSFNFGLVNLIHLLVGHRN